VLLKSDKNSLGVEEILWTKEDEIVNLDQEMIGL
jgi:hypothetical protein